jgi:hypothetical protein
MVTSLSRSGDYKLLNFYPSFENVHALLMEIRLYAFGEDGLLIQSQTIRRDRAVLAMSEAEMEHAKILIAPVIEGAKGGPPSLAMVREQNAYEFDIRLDGAQSNYELPPIPEAVWRWWLVHSLWPNIPAANPAKKLGLLGW